MWNVASFYRSVATGSGTWPGHLCALRPWPNRSLQAHAKSTLQVLPIERILVAQWLQQQHAQCCADRQNPCFRSMPCALSANLVYTDSNHTANSSPMGTRSSPAQEVHTEAPHRLPFRPFPCTIVNPSSSTIGAGFSLGSCCCCCMGTPWGASPSSSMQSSSSPSSSEELSSIPSASITVPSLSTCKEVKSTAVHRQRQEEACFLKVLGIVQTLI